MNPALDLTDEEWDFNFVVNARGVFLTNQVAARQFVAQGPGVIVSTAPLAAKVGAPLLAHYSASNSRFWAGRRRSHANSRPKASGSTLSAPDLCARAYRSAR